MQNIVLGRETTNTTSHTISMPSGLSAGDLLLVFIATDGDNTISNWDGLTELENASNGTAVSLSVGYKIADGSEGSTLTFTTTSNEQSVYIACRITGYGTPQISAVNSGTSINPVPNSLSPSGGALDYMCISLMGSDRDKTVSSFPSDYPSENFQYTATGANGVTCAMAKKELNDSTITSNQYTISGSEQWLSFLVVVPPPAPASNYAEISGLTESNISEVDGVSQSNISKVNGVNKT